MLEDLIARYPASGRLITYKYQLLASDDTVAPETLFEILAFAERTNPEHLEIYPYQMMEYQRATDSAAVHEAVLAWLQQDGTRRQLPHRREYAPVARCCVRR